jgi:hypothetical protein
MVMLLPLRGKKINQRKNEKSKEKKIKNQRLFCAFKAKKS